MVNEITPEGWEFVDIGDESPTLGLEFLAPTVCWWEYVPLHHGSEKDEEYDFNTRNLIEYEFDWTLPEEPRPARIVDGKIDFCTDDVPFLPKDTVITGHLPAEMLAQFTKINPFVEEDWLKQKFSGIGGFDDQSRNYAKYHVFGEDGTNLWMDEEPFDEDFGDKVRDVVGQCQDALKYHIGFTPSQNFQVGALVTIKAHPQRAHCDYNNLETISQEFMLPWIVVIPLTKEVAVINVWPGPC